jgi:two-component system response regulator MtrA
MNSRILVVEDDTALARVLRDNLTFQGFDVDWAVDGESALSALRTRAPDLILLDIMLPGTTGFDLLGLLHQERRVPVIILTVRSQKADKLNGLRLGADDYITKPFDLEELLARVQVVLRRTRGTTERVTLGQVTVDFRARTVTSGEALIHMTHLEFELLKYLAGKRDRVVYRDELLREVWKYRDLPITRSVDNAVGRLRKKIEPHPTRPVFLHTVRGDGYCLTPDGDA